MSWSLRALLRDQGLPARQRSKQLNVIFQLRDFLIQELTQRFVNHPWPAQFLLIVSPLVTWLWIGAIIAALGGLIALWPMPPQRRCTRRTGGPPFSAAPSMPPVDSPEPLRERELV